MSHAEIMQIFMDRTHTIFNFNIKQSCKLTCPRVRWRHSIAHLGQQRAMDENIGVFVFLCFLKSGLNFSSFGSFVLRSEQPGVAWFRPVTAVIPKHLRLTTELGTTMSD